MLPSIKGKFIAFNQFLKSKKGLVYLLVLIVGINTALYYISRTHHFSPVQSRKDASGFVSGKGEQFLYFYYYTHHFPLATTQRNLEFSTTAAWQEIKNNPSQLIMEYGHWSRLGEHARIWCFLPNVWLQGNTQHPHIKLFNAMVFTLSLVLFYIACWYVKYAFSALVLIGILLSTPFYWYEVFTHPNIFALLSCTFLIVWALLLPFKHYGKWQYLSVVLCGVCIGLFSEVRNEIQVVLLSGLILLFAMRLKFVRKLFLCSVLCLSFLLTQQSIRQYFTYQFNKTSELVKQVGGKPYLGKRIDSHRFWHPVFCGLGDFDTQYNYPTKDTAAYRYAVPILNQQYGLGINYSGKYHTDNFYDTDSLYYVKFDEIPQYEAVLKNKILSDVYQDPIWLLKILTQRLNRILVVTLPFPFMGYVLILLIVYLLYYKEYTFFFILLSSFPLSLSPFLFYSGSNATFNSFFPFVALFCIIQIVLQRSKILTSINKIF